MISSPDLIRNYGLLTVLEYVDPLTRERKRPTNYGEDLDITMTWTTRIDLDLPMPAKWQFSRFGEVKGHRK